MVKSGKNQAAAKAFVAGGALARGPGEAPSGRVRHAVSTAAASGAPLVGERDRAWRPSLGRVAVAVAVAVVIAVVLAFLLLPIVALVTYQPVG